MASEYEDLLQLLRVKAKRKAPNNVIWGECVKAIEELMAENKRLEAQIVGEIERIGAEK